MPQTLTSDDAAGVVALAILLFMKDCQDRGIIDATLELSENELLDRIVASAVVVTMLMVMDE